MSQKRKWSVISIFTGQINSIMDDFDEKDIENIMNNDNFVRKYFEYNNENLVESFKMMTNALMWRKTFGVNQLNEWSFPRECYLMGGIFTYGKDVNGSTCIIFRVNSNKKFSDWTELVKKYIVFLIEKENQKFLLNQNKGICIVFDCKGSGITNVDLDMLWFIVSTLRHYYPMLLKSVVVNELPFILKFVLKLVKSWLGKENQQLIHLVTKKDLNQYIENEQLPDFMNGTNKKLYKLYPKNAPLLEDMALKMGIKKDDLKKLSDYIKPYVKDQSKLVTLFNLILFNFIII